MISDDYNYTKYVQNIFSFLFFSFCVCSKCCMWRDQQIPQPVIIKELSSSLSSYIPQTLMPLVSEHAEQRVLVVLDELRDKCRRQRLLMYPYFKDFDRVGTAYTTVKFVFFTVMCLFQGFLRRTWAIWWILHSLMCCFLCTSTWHSLFRGKEVPLGTYCLWAHF